MVRKPKVAVIGAALDLGASRRGVDMGPSAIRLAGLRQTIEKLGYSYHDRGNVHTPIAETRQSDGPIHYLSEILDSCLQLAEKVGRSVCQGELPLVLGGDHSIALGTLAGLRAAHGQSGGVIWVDAHGDLNTPQTSPSGNMHGMVLAAALGQATESFHHQRLPLPAVRPEKTVLIASRSLDPGEKALIAELGITVYSMSEIDRHGIETIVGQALEQAGGAAFLHLSLDMDALDPTIAPGVGTPVRGGLSYREAHLAFELIAASGLLQSLEIVETNPILDRANITGELAVELIASVLGSRIL